MHGTAFGCGGDGEPIFFGLFFGVTTSVLPSVDAGIACGWPLFIDPVIMGRQMHPVILCKRAR